MKLWKQFRNWWRRTFTPSEFDNGYTWAQQELWWGVTGDSLLAQISDYDKTDFDRGMEQAIREHYAKRPK